MLTTVNVTVKAADQNGAPLAGATITAKLNSLEVSSQSYVVPDQVEGIADAQGIAVLPLWPNELGTTQSQYDFRIVDAITGKAQRLTATIPNADCNLHEIADLPQYEGKTDGQLAVDAAVAAVAPAISAMNAAQASAVTAQAAVVAAQAVVDTATTAFTSQALTLGTNLIATQTLVAQLLATQ